MQFVVPFLLYIDCTNYHPNVINSLIYELPVMQTPDQKIENINLFGNLQWLQIYFNIGCILSRSKVMSKNVIVVHDQRAIIPLFYMLLPAVKHA